MSTNVERVPLARPCMCAAQSLALLPLPTTRLPVLCSLLGSTYFTEIHLQIPTLHPSPCCPAAAAAPSHQRHRHTDLCSRGHLCRSRQQGAAWTVPTNDAAAQQTRQPRAPEAGDAGPTGLPPPHRSATVCAQTPTPASPQPGDPKICSPRCASMVLGCHQISPAACGRGWWRCRCCCCCCYRAAAGSPAADARPPLRLPVPLPGSSEACMLSGETAMRASSYNGRRGSRMG